MKVKSESEVTQSCPTLSDPMDCSLPGSSIRGIFQARVLEWGAIAFSKFLLGFILLGHSVLHGLVNFLSHVGEAFDYNLFKTLLRPFIFPAMTVCNI